MTDTQLSKTMNKYLDDLHEAEFGYKYGEKEPLYPKSNPKQMVKLLRQALNWKTYKNLKAVCVYLGAETDNRIDTVPGCKMIISEDIKAWLDEC